MVVMGWAGGRLALNQAICQTRVPWKTGVRGIGRQEPTSGGGHSRLVPSHHRRSVFRPKVLRRRNQSMENQANQDREGAENEGDQAGRLSAQQGGGQGGQ